ncbi:hypothetical protein [Nocardia sp. NPDC004711]
MTPAVEPRKKSALAGEHPAWSVPANPATPAGPVPAPPASNPVAAVANTAAAPAVSKSRSTPSVGKPATREAPRGRSRDLAEARGRKRTRDAAYAWAAAEQKALLRLEEFVAELGAALERGTDVNVLGEYITEACERNGIDRNLLPAEVLTAAGLPTNS